MQINVVVPTDDYVLITTTDLGRLVQMLKAEGVFEQFRQLDVRAIGINYTPAATAPETTPEPETKAPPGPKAPSAPESRPRCRSSRHFSDIVLTAAQRNCLRVLVATDTVPKYQGTKLLNGPFPFTRNTLRALAHKGCLEEREIETSVKKGPLKYKDKHGGVGYFLTDLGIRLGG